MSGAGWKAVLKDLAPPVLLSAYRRIAGGGIRYEGPYPDWESAKRAASGYDQAAILERVRAAAIEVRDGRAAYERDSVAFAEPAHRFPLLAALLRSAARNAGRLSVLDFGGSLGSSYFQCRGFLRGAAKLEWNVVEQERFVACGRAEFANEELRFFRSIEECVAERAPAIALLSSVLPYVDDPYGVLTKVCVAVGEVVIDRTHCHEGAEDLVFVQKVPASLYAASYPCRVFSRARLEAALAESFDLDARFDASEGPARAGGVELRYTGSIWTRRSAKAR